jgi:small GTP-binding protein
MSDYLHFSESNQPVSQVIKIVILGDGAVGKTTLIHAVNNFISTYGTDTTSSKLTERTKFIDYHVVPSAPHSSVVYSIWDLQGQQHVKNFSLDLIPDCILGGVSLIIFVFAINDAQSFENLFTSDGWYPIICDRIEYNSIPVLFIGNKIDLRQEVIPESAEQICQRYPTSVGFLLTSAITGVGIKNFVSILSDYSGLSHHNYQILESENFLRATIKQALWNNGEKP